jgi:CubicO group peptidase (beta-lactamase class C family)
MIRLFFVEVFFAAIIGLVISSAVAEEASPAAPYIALERAYADLLDPMVTEQLIPGYYLAVHKGGEQVVDLSRGYADQASETRPNQDTLYFIASMTKPIVSLAALRLVEQGLLRLEDPVKQFIPGFGNLMVVPGGDYDNPAEELQRDVTIRDLLTHTSGLTYSQDITGREEIAKVYAELGIFAIDGLAKSELGALSQHIEQLEQLPLVFQPGEAFVYSVGIDVIGRVLEIVSKKSLDALISELVLDPLGMTDTYFKIPSGKADRLAALYAPRVATYPIPGVYRRYQPYQSLPAGQKNFGMSGLGYLSGGAGLISTARDYAKFLSVLTNGFLVGGEPLLSSDLGNQMFQNQLPVALGDRGLTYNFGASAKATGFSYGLGIKLVKGGSLEREEDHDYYFWAGAANTGFWIDKKSGTIGVFMTQHLPTQYDRIAEMVELGR